GAVKTPEGKYDLTQYTSCMNQDKCIYYYNTYKKYIELDRIYLLEFLQRHLA
ncbi:linear amide C-N hydrolase, partial [Escherichia sp. SP-MK]